MTRQYDTREVTHGISWGAFAKITKTAEGKLDTTIKPKVFTGLRGTSIETSQESSASYADNVEHVRILGKQTNEGEITCYQIAQQFMVDHLAKKLVKETGALLDTGTRLNFIWQYIETVNDEFGGEIEQLCVWYNVKAGAPTGSSATDEDGIEFKEITIPVTASPNSLVLDADGGAVTNLILRKTDENAPLFDLAYNQIIMPDTLVTTVPEV